MDIEDFLRERKPVWSRLEQLLAKAEQSPPREFGHQRIRELVMLYRQACSDLNHARALTANPEILDRLNQLTGQAYRFIYRGARKEGLGGTFKRFAVLEVPRTFRAEAPWALAALAAMLLGGVFGFGAVVAAPWQAELLIPGPFFNASPSERVARIERNDERIKNTEDALLFGASLYTHNIQVSFLCFTLGALTLVGGPLLLFYNGMILGAVAAMYFLDGVTVFFVSWVGPHGALELPAILFSGAAGMRLGRALWLPGRLEPADALREAFPAVWKTLATVMAMLVVAGLIEGSFSQFSAKSAPYALKLFVAAGLFAALLFHLYYPRRAAFEGPR